MSRIRFGLLLVLLLALTTAAYLPVVDAPYLWDDHTLIEGEAAAVRRAKPFAVELREPMWTEGAWSDANPAYYRPLVMLSYRANFALRAGFPAGFHVANVALHLLATLLLAAACRRLGASRPRALVVAGLWASFPRLTEAVAWISGRTDVLCGAFSFAALVCWPWRGSGKRRHRGSSRRGSRPRSRASRARCSRRRSRWAWRSRWP